MQQQPTELDRRPELAVSPLVTPPFEATRAPDPEELPTPAPLKSRRSSFTIIGGLAQASVVVDRTLTTRYTARFEGPQPEISEQGDEITLRYPHNPLHWGPVAAEIRLHPAYLWSLRVRGGLSRGEFDLRDGQVADLEVSGGVSRLTLTLPSPGGAVPIRIAGGLSRLDLDRPAGTPVSVEINGGASRLVLDDQSLGAIGGPVRLQTPGFAEGRASYRLIVGGGASRLSVQTR